METIIIKIQVRDEIEAYRVLNKVNYEHKVVEAKYKRGTYKFNKNNLPKNFLKKKFLKQ